MSAALKTVFLYLLVSVSVQCQNAAKLDQFLDVDSVNQTPAPQSEPTTTSTQPTEKILNTADAKPMQTLVDGGIHDTDNPALKVLQDPTVALKGFPVDRRMQIDWVKAIDQGLVKPRAELNGTGDMLTMDLDIIMRNTKNMPYVRFPHLAHTKWLDCTNCHPKIFEPTVGSNPITMNKILRGEYCGICHDSVAFSLFVCERCHSVPHKFSGKWWK